MARVVSDASADEPIPPRSVVLDVEGMTCASCALRVRKSLAQVPGVLNAHVNFATHRAYVEIEAATDPKALEEAVRRAGYGGKMPEPGVRRRPSVVYDLERSRTGWRLVMALVLSTPFLVRHLDFSHHGFLPLWAQALWATPIFFVGGWPFHERALRNLRRLDVNMDTLISLGSGVAYFASFPALLAGNGESFFDACALIITFILVGRWIEVSAKRKTGQAVERLMDLQPGTAHVIQETRQVDVPVEAVGPEDLLAVRPGESFPVDGEVVEGRSLADESLLTGESIPAEKTSGSRVYGGTLNGQGTLTIRASAVGEKTTLAGIIRMVEEAQGTKAPLEKMADRVSSIFVPTVLVVAALTWVGWMAWGNATWSEALVRAVAVLVVACPCALGLATPTALLVGTGIAARRGILLRRAEVLERAASLQVVVFDKTGTLTEGKPRLVDAYVAEDMTESKVLRYAGALEAHTNHPLAAALLKEVMVLHLPLPHAEEVHETPGGGLRGRVEGHEVVVGTKAFVEAVLEGAPTEQERAHAEAFRQGGQTIAYLGIEGKVAAIFAMEDPLRADASEAVGLLKKQGLKVHLLTGDGPVVAERVARRVGADHFVSNAAPGDKLSYVKDLQGKGFPVAVVGDGYNDAPALTQADLGVALGTGTDVARAAGDLVLLKPELAKVEEALRLSKDVLRTILQNLAWAFGYNVLMIPLAALSPLPPALAALAMSLSSVSVVGNSLRLYWKWR